jgi:hypothetical protein
METMPIDELLLIVKTSKNYWSRNSCISDHAREFAIRGIQKALDEVLDLKEPKDKDITEDEFYVFVECAVSYRRWNVTMSTLWTQKHIVEDFTRAANRVFDLVEAESAKIRRSAETLSYVPRPLPVLLDVLATVMYLSFVALMVSVILIWVLMTMIIVSMTTQTWTLMIGKTNPCMRMIYCIMSMVPVVHATLLVVVQTLMRHPLVAHGLSLMIGLLPVLVLFLMMILTSRRAVML